MRCSNCNAEQMTGSIFCSECGAALVGNKRKETTASLSSDQQNSDHHDFPPITPMIVNAPGGTRSAHLFVLESGRRIKLHDGSELIVGRRDHQRGFFPDIDLSLEGGIDAGVSRRHARLSVVAGRFYIQDLGSANGTFVNGRRVTAKTSTPISNGDELAFGSLVLRFELE